MKKLVFYITYETSSRIKENIIDEKNKKKDIVEAEIDRQISFNI